MSILAPLVKVRPRVGPTELQYYWSPPAIGWVAVGTNSDSSVCIAKSTDGVTWTPSANNPFSGGACNGIAWNGSYLIAVGLNSTGTVSIAKSTDGMTWTNATDNPFSGNGGQGIAWNGSYWIAVGYNSDATVCIAKSTDGMTWTASTDNPFSGGVGKGIAWNGSYWIAVGLNSTGTVTIAKSTDGMTWTNATDNPFSSNVGNGIAWNGSYWVAVGYNTGSTVTIAKSTDGMIWTNATDNPFNGSVGNGIAWNGSYWIAVGYGSATIAKSTDGMTWTNIENPLSEVASGIAWNGSYWLATGYNTGSTITMAKSTDGLTWTESGSPFPGGQGFGITYANLSITGFVLESASPSVSVSVGAAEVTKTITGLTTDTDYSFTIKTDISGSYSAQVPFRTVHTSAKPEPVASLIKSQSVNGELSVTFTWTNPGDYAYYYLLGLRAAAGTKDSIYSGTSDYATLSRTFTGLDPTRAYTFNIQRGNDAGYSAVTSITTTAAIVFDPNTVPGLHLWLDAADVSGNGSIVADGTTVTKWYDKSDEANNGTATTGAVIQTDSLGRYLDFTGSSWYDLSANNWAYNQYYTIFVVDKPIDYAANYTLVGRQAVSTDLFYIQYATDGIRLSSQGDNAALGDTFESLTAPVNIWCFTNYGGKTAYWNRLISGKNPVAAYITDALLSIGAKQAGSEPYNGKMREILIYTGVMSETNRETITTYLYNKWYTQPTLIPLMPAENGTVLWLDAYDIKTFFQDVSGTIPVTATNSTVQLWKDKSGFGNDMQIPGGALYTADVYSFGLPGFDSYVQVVQTANYLQTGDASLFLVGWAESGVGDYFFKHDSSGNFGLTYNGSGISWVESGSLNNNQFPYTSGKYMFYGTMRKGQLIAGTFINDSKIYTSYAVDTLVLPVAEAPITLSASANVVYFEVIYYNRVLTESEIEQNAAYLSNKWAIPIPSSVFSPPVAPGLQVWLDSSDPYTVFKSGDAVIAWKDRSGNGNNAVPYGAPTVNNGIVFDGSGQYFSLPDGALPRSNYSYYIVTDVSGSSAVIHGGSKDISGQMFVVAGSGGVAASYDLLVWINTSNLILDARGIAWNGSYWVAVGVVNTGVCITKSTDGINWTASTNNPFLGGTGYGIAWNGSYWIAVGYNSGSTITIIKSTDGDTWTDASDNPFSGGGGQGTGIAWNGSYWIAVGNNSDYTVTIAKSTDGDTWTDASDNPFSGNLGRGIAWNGSYWIAVGNNSGYTVTIAKSTDGLTWTVATENPFSGGVGFGIAWNGSYWIAVGSNGTQTVTIAKSTDGDTWVPATNNLFYECYTASWFGSYWVVLGNPLTTGTMATSTDGLIWTSASNPFPGELGYGIAVGIAPVHNSLIDIKVNTYAETIFDSNGTISSLTDTNAIPASTTVIIESLYDGAGKTLFLSGITGATDSSTLIQDASNNFIGWDLSGTYMNGTIKEILVYGAAHTEEERKQVETYLKNKWYPDTYVPTGMSLWLDGASASNFTLSGANVTSWKDKSGLNNNFTQSAAWAQPIYSLDPVTGKYGVQFAANGIANGIASATSPFGTTDSFSIFMVQRYDYSTNDNTELVNLYICTAYEMTGNEIASSVGTQDTGTPSTGELLFVSNGAGAATTVEIHKAPVLTSQIINSLVGEDFVNGSNIIDYSLNSGVTSASNINIGFTGALSPALGGAMRGYIYEIIVFNTPVDGSTQEAVEGYLAWKWGIQNSLPTTHPYYIAPPTA